MTLDGRIEREQKFHDASYSENRRGKQVGKFYSIAGSIFRAYRNVILASSRGKRAVEYGCGTGSFAFLLAENGAELVTGIDISSVAIETARQTAKERNLQERIDFQIMNAEQLEFAESSYDLICGSGILHHLDLERAINSIVRTLKPEGKAIFIEPLGHNLAIELYRHRTPNLRSEDEHPLLAQDLKAISNRFGQSKIRYFYLTSLAAIFLANKPGFKFTLNCCQWLDGILLRLPIIKYQAWMVLIELKQPIK